MYNIGPVSPAARRPTGTVANRTGHTDLTHKSTFGFQPVGELKKVDGSKN